ncbi:DUF4132 domain-containing protein [Micromonospora sp. DR5-3]|uniref:DUF4132 domain-containing protein n=1 Tax=unclassified Micromonospora TaxID=2617518 RepID=UPI0011D94BE7|nr:MULTISPECIES: DUF4132 domain-containing protein [unclassified Micromonospora]MCW3820757.1 DUF4132 domain-containing protein [Micromonospora sp. DR5-3]TYC13423.1 DUF4132 domain-containing protein [Micromonospora sp. MP36]
MPIASGDTQYLEILASRLMSRQSPEQRRAAATDLRRFLEHMGGLWTCWDCEDFAALLKFALQSGVPVPAATVATARRSVLTGYHTGELNAVTVPLERPVLNPGEAWADAVLDALPAAGEGWSELLAHALTATTGKPTARWTNRGRALLAEVGAAGYRERVLGWLAMVGRPRTLPVEGGYWGYDVGQAYDPFNATALRGLVWLLPSATGDDDADVARALAALVETSLRKVAGLGPRNPKIANAAVHALAELDGEHALAQLARLASRITYKGTLNQLNAALDRRAAALGLSRDEVEELAVPTYGLSEVGLRQESVGETTAELTITGPTVQVAWRTAAGRMVKSAPAATRRDHPDEVRDLKAAAKDVEKMLAAQAERLDRQFLAQRTWSYGSWRLRYLNHPLVGTLARRLIWLVDGAACCWSDGALRTVDDTPVCPADDAVVTLWHPIGRPVDEVVAWRVRLERHAVVQPFKQAHREVYLLTAAEEQTGVYSNRFAAHVLRQHQFHALAAVRGWRNKLRLMVDDTYPPATRELPGWGLRAEFWVEGIGDETTGTGSYLRLSTDQVRFYPIQAPENSTQAGEGRYTQWVQVGERHVDPLPLHRIPPLVFSEVMRDVDLFVGVASVGNDPTWQDGGPAGRYQEYWQSYSFGELSATAETRRDLLARLVPRLAVADRCALDGRFLTVRGDLRTYKIHLGSGNILMTPNDQYLCIVPKQTIDTTGGQVFLPFEGDRMLGVILSKAMLLAKDTAITDPTIVSQIRR